MTTTIEQFPGEHSTEGEFNRQDDAFRSWIKPDGSTPFTPEKGRYHLYVSLACPWAHRTLIVRHLKKLASLIGVTVVDPVRDERGWAFRDGSGHTRDPINGFEFLRDAYLATNPHFNGRWTVPVLWTSKHAASSTTPKTTSAGCSTIGSTVSLVRIRPIFFPLRSRQNKTN